jgi:lysozyme
MDRMRISQIGIDLIKFFEGCKLTAYLDASGTWTIGYGHTRLARSGWIINQAEAEDLLKTDLLHTEALIRGLGLSLNQNQFDALVSLVYNIGIGNLRRSTLLRMLQKDPNDFFLVYEFPKWRKAGGKILPGLERRRKAEAILYFTGKGVRDE